MNGTPFDEFFLRATGNLPYDYQRRLACGEPATRPASQWLAGGTPCQSQLINIPTGLGKTAAVILAWLWNRLAARIADRKFSECDNRDKANRVTSGTNAESRRLGVHGHGKEATE